MKSLFCLNKLTIKRLNNNFLSWLTADKCIIISSILIIISFFTPWIFNVGTRDPLILKLKLGTIKNGVAYLRLFDDPQKTNLILLRDEPIITLILIVFSFFIIYERAFKKGENLTFYGLLGLIYILIWGGAIFITLLPAERTFGIYPGLSIYILFVAGIFDIIGYLKYRKNKKSG